MIVFDPLWDTMKRRNITQYALIKEHGVSTGTLDALRENRSVTLHTITTSAAFSGAACPTSYAMCRKKKIKSAKRNG